MMTEPLYLSLDPSRIALEISRAKHSVCYAAPGILQKPADALADLARRIGPKLITVCLDFDERVMRMGFGEFSAVKTLRDANIDVRSTPGLRTGIVIIDDDGYIFTPTALYLEAGPTTEAPNAMRLSKDQVTEALTRLSPAAKAIAVAFAETDEERKRIMGQAVEVQSEKVTNEEIETVEKRLKEVPPVKFDIARQVRVYSSYLQYVEMKLLGAAIQRHRLAIPPKILELGGGEDLDGRLRTTFDLIENSDRLSSKALGGELNKIREDLTRSLGKKYGRVVLKSVKPHFEKRLEDLREDLKQHQERVKKELQGKLNDSKKMIVDYYQPKVVATPPAALLGGLLHPPPTEDDARKWLNAELDKVFPKAEKLIQNMQLDITYKDVTFESLNSRDFFDLVKSAFPETDWDKVHEEFQAAGEK